MNVADDATKWSKKLNVNIDTRWFKGPEFLLKAENDWPVDISTQYQTKEEMVMARTICNKQQLIDFNRFSKWSKVIRSIAYATRFGHILKARIGKKRYLLGDLTSDELLKAEQATIRIVQAEHYANELNDLLVKKSVTVSRDSSIYKLSPYMDEFGIIRARGRIDAATCVPFETKRPIILPPKSRATRLLVESYHEKFLHIHHDCR